MGARDILTELRSDGLSFSLTDAGLSVSPRAALTEAHRGDIRENRARLIAALEAEGALKTALVAAINRTCDVRGDNDTNRAALIEECSRLNPTEHADMCEHFAQEATRFSFGGTAAAATTQRTLKSARGVK